MGEIEKWVNQRTEKNVHICQQATVGKRKMIVRREIWHSWKYGKEME